MMWLSEEEFMVQERRAYEQGCYEVIDGSRDEWFVESYFESGYSDIDYSHSYASEAEAERAIARLEDEHGWHSDSYEGWQVVRGGSYRVAY